MRERRPAALAVLALAAAAVFVLPAGSASAGTSTVSNACANSVTANFSQIAVATSGDDGLTTVAPGGATTTSGLGQSAAVPNFILVAGYNLGLLQQGTNNLPVNAQTKIEATNTTQGTQTTNTVGGTPPNGSVTATTVITDPDETPGTGDESATDAAFSVTYDNLSWTVGAGTIDYRQQSIAPGTRPTAPNHTLRIQAMVGGLITVTFHCAPGTVTPPDPGTVTTIDPAPPFDTTLFEGEPVNQAPTADAGADQLVNSGALVQLDGTGSIDPNSDTLTYAWTQTAGTPVALFDSSSAVPTFTPGTGSATPLEFQLQVCDPEPLCDTDTVVVTVERAPTADAGAAQTVDSGATVSLDGTGSSDPEGEALTYEWTQFGGPEVTLTGGDTATPSFTAPTGPVILAFSLEVCDPVPLCAADFVGVTVNAPDPTQVPTANAGADQTVAPGSTVNLDGTGSSDPNGDPLTYAWTKTSGPAVSLTGADTATPSFTAPTGSAFLLFQLKVCDPGPLCDTDFVVVRVNEAPTANAGSNQSVASGAAVSLNGTASSDPDGDVLTYAWSQVFGPAVTLTGANTPTPSLTAPVGPATLEFQLEVCDPEPLCDTGNVVVAVQAPVMPPPAAPPVSSAPAFNLKAAIKKCKRKFPKGPKRRKCIKKARNLPRLRVRSVRSAWTFYGVSDRGLEHSSRPNFLNWSRPGS